MRDPHQDTPVPASTDAPAAHEGELGRFLVDGQGTLLGFDDGMELLTGWAAVEVVGARRSAGVLRSGYRFWEGDLAEGGVAALVHLRLRCRDGRMLDVEAFSSPLQGAGARRIVRVQRVLALSPAPASEGALGGCDPLTGLAGPEAFESRLEAEFRRSGPLQPLALILADVDRLRRINDRLGRPAGDGVLAQVGAIVRTASAADDLIARIGDDDFAVLLPGAGRGDARRTAATLRSRVEQYPFFAPEQEAAGVKVTMSLGAASSPADADSAQDLLSRAREALDEARSFGRNRVWCYVRRPRVPLETPVYFDAAEPLLLGVARDLSPSGLFVHTPVPLDPGLVCALTFPLPGWEGNVHVLGRVVRTVSAGGPGADGRDPGMGIEFEGFGAEERRAIDSYLFQHAEKTRRPETGLLSF
jgi:diguanylate cyclase (GGDEF)-like protein